MYTYEGMLFRAAFWGYRYPKLA